MKKLHFSNFSNWVLIVGMLSRMKQIYGKLSGFLWAEFQSKVKKWHF